MTSELKVGVLFFLGMGLITSFVFFFSNPFKKKGDFSVRFSRVVRLQPGDAVSYNGVKVGTVTNVTPVLAKDPTTQRPISEVEVVYSVDGSIRDAVLIDEDTEYKIAQGLLGGSALEIISRTGEPMSNGMKPTDAHGTEPVAIDEIMASIRAMVEENRAEIRRTIITVREGVQKFGDMSEQVGDMVKENRAQVSSTIVNVGGMAESIRDLVKKNNETITQAIANIKDLAKQMNEMVAENREQVKIAIARFSVAGENVGNAAKSIEGAVNENRENLKKTIDGLGKVGPRLDRISENLELVTTQIAQGKGTVGKLVFEDTLHDKAVQTIDNFNQRLEEVKPITSGFSQLKFYGGLEAGANADTGATDSYAYLRIEPRPWKFYEGGVSYRTAPTDRRSRREDPDKFHLDFNILLGWRFLPSNWDQVYHLTVAGGVIDSQIGGWVSTPLWKDRLALKAMCRRKDYERDPTERRYEEGKALLRATAEFRVWSHVYLIAGCDDILDRPGFWGALRGEILDNDLRNLTTGAGIAP
ncbi:MAG: MCE family protein [Planctomycetes bacterium]|nr:MCE family protein [Planctomycetota bacterium]